MIFSATGCGTRYDIAKGQEALRFPRTSGVPKRVSHCGFCAGAAGTAGEAGAATAGAAAGRGSGAAATGGAGGAVGAGAVIADGLAAIGILGALTSGAGTTGARGGVTGDGALLTASGVAARGTTPTPASGVLGASLVAGAESTGLGADLAGPADADSSADVAGPEALPSLKASSRLALSRYAANKIATAPPTTHTNVGTPPRWGGSADDGTSSTEAPPDSTRVLFATGASTAARVGSPCSLACSARLRPALRSLREPFAPDRLVIRISL
jgi:hypothetical protein